MTTPAAGGRTELLVPLIAAVQYNCDLSDARHAREGGLCTYLLGMRELYRWSAGAAPGAPLDRAAVGAWISERESVWDDLHDSAADYRTLPLGAGVDAFDEAKADADLRTRGLLYGGGIGRFGAPVFFLAQRLHETTRDTFTILCAGRELARGLVAPPALSRDRRIVVRTDAMRRWLWTRAEAASLRTPSTALAALFDAYGGATPDAIERIVTEQTETLVLHEIGELQAGQVLGPDWERMLLALDDRRCENIVRGLRDLVADCLVTLPALLDRGSTVALRFWQANLEGVRRVLAPRLARFDDATLPAAAGALADVCATERGRLQRAALDLLACWRAGGVPAVRQTVEALLAAAQPS